MTDPSQVENSSGKAVWAARLLWLIPLVLMITAMAVLVFRRGQTSEFAWLRLPQEHIRISDSFARGEVLPAKRGALAGDNVLLITLDTTRAGRLGCYGNITIATPALDRLARAGVIFSRAIAPTPTTLPSHASILTGLYPRHHGVRSNGLFRLGNDHVTLAEILSRQGYRTGAVISAFVLDARFGLAQGFDDYQDDVDREGVNQELGVSERRADATTEHALRWMDGATDKPFFLWVHYFDPHANYAPPEPFAKRYAKNLYDGEIAFVDQQIARLVAHLEDSGAAEHTLIVVTGDHGESLAEHGEHTHGYLLYDVTLRVPLIMHGERLGAGAGLHIDRLVSSVDIVPTVLALLGVDTDARFDGVDLATPPTADRPVFTETYHGFMECGWAALLGVYSGNHKLIHSPSPELYDLSVDPFERNNLYAQNTARENELSTMLRQHFGAEVEPDAAMTATTSLSRAELARLQALGYAFAGPGETESDQPRRDPKTRIALINRIFEITCYYEPRGMLDESVALLEELADEYPDSYVVFFNLANAYWDNDQLPKAQAAFAECLAIRPHTTDATFRLAQVTVALGEDEHAIELYEQLVARHPEHIEGYRELAQALVRRQRYQEAAKQVRRAFELDADKPDTARQLARTYVRAGLHRELRTLLRAALADDPQRAHVRSLLANQLVRDAEYAQAESLLRKGVKHSPKSPAVLTRLAWFLVNCPDETRRRPEEAARLTDDMANATDATAPAVILMAARVRERLGDAGAALRLAHQARETAAAQGDDNLRSVIDQFILRVRPRTKDER